jgi:hypothetical protein
MLNLRLISDRDDHHKHVVKLIESYAHHRNGHTIELGLLLLPVLPPDPSLSLYIIDLLKFLTMLGTMTA